MTIWVVLGVLGIAMVTGVVLYLRGGSLAERRALRGELRRIRAQEEHQVRGRHEGPVSDHRHVDGILTRDSGTFMEGVSAAAPDASGE